MDVDMRELLEVGSKYCLIMTRPRCSGHPMAVVSKSWRPWATKLSCEACSSREFYSQYRWNKFFYDLLLLQKINTHIKKSLTILFVVSFAALDIIWPDFFMRAIFHFMCHLMGDEASTNVLMHPDWDASSNHFLFLFSMNFSSRKS